MFSRLIKTFLLTAIIMNVSISPVLAEIPNTTAESAILIEQNTGRVLYDKNKDEKKPMASTTKIMTALVAIEKGNLNSKVTISKEASGIEGSSIWLEENEELTLEELLYGLMLRSGNDAAYAIAEHIGKGNINNFIKMMNEKARELNALNTHFTNPHGLDNKNHYTTAYDLANIASYAMGNEIFKKIVSTEKKSISWSNHQWNRSLLNKNKILRNYEGGNGIKTGYTTKAGKCLVASAFKDNMQLISVVLKSKDIWEDSTNLLDHAFDNYKPYLIVDKNKYLRSISVIEGVKERVKVYSEDKIIIPIKDSEKEKVKVKISLPEKLIAPINKNQVIGTIDVFIDDAKIKSSKIIALENIEQKNTKEILEKLIKYWINF